MAARDLKPRPQGRGFSLTSADILRCGKPCPLYPRMRTWSGGAAAPDILRYLLGRSACFIAFSFRRARRGVRIEAALVLRLPEFLIGRILIAPHSLMVTTSRKSSVPQAVKSDSLALMPDTMATRQYRLNEFDQGSPPLGRSLELLCEDHSGTYLLPYLCHWSDGVWHNSAIGNVIECRVIGWRVPL
jgi:hypothetical protein